MPLVGGLVFLVGKGFGLAADSVLDLHIGGLTVSVLAAAQLGDDVDVGALVELGELWSGLSPRGSAVLLGAFFPLVALAEEDFGRD